VNLSMECEVLDIFSTLPVFYIPYSAGEIG
jgi:hypothetical protein